MVRAFPKPPRMRIIKSAGALVWRVRAGQSAEQAKIIPTANDQIEVLLVHRPKYNDWSWPKGKRERHESLVACAVREVEEETGVVIRLGAPLTTQRYRLGSGATKEVHYWVGHTDVSPKALACRPPVSPAHPAEIDRIRWTTPSKAMKLLTRRGDRRLLEELLGKLQSGQLVTKTVVFVRHAKALDRKDWTNQPESKRPLTRSGVNQALKLLPALSAWGITEVRSSPWRRCLATVAPYATLGGAELKTESVLTEDSYRQDPLVYRQLIAAWIDTPPTEPTAICIHRPTIPGIIGELAVRSPNWLGHKYPQTDPYLEPGALMVAHLVSGIRPAMVPPHNRLGPLVFDLSTDSQRAQRKAASFASSLFGDMPEDEWDFDEDNFEFEEVEAEPLHMGHLRQNEALKQEPPLPAAGPARVMAASLKARKLAESRKATAANESTIPGSGPVSTAHTNAASSPLGAFSSIIPALPGPTITEAANTPSPVSAAESGPLVETCGQPTSGDASLPNQVSVIDLEVITLDRP